MNDNNQLLVPIAKALARNHGEPDEATSAGYLSDARAVLTTIAPHLLPDFARAEDAESKWADLFGKLTQANTLLDKCQSLLMNSAAWDNDGPVNEYAELFDAIAKRPAP